MKRLISTIAALSAAAFASAPAPAFQDASTRETRALMHSYAKCVVQRQGKKAAEALLANVDNGTIVRKYRMLVIGDCLRSPAFSTTKMSFGGDLYRYALADALVSRDFASSPAPVLAAVPPLQHRDPGEAPKPVSETGKRLSDKIFQDRMKDHGESVAYNFLSRYGECVVRLDAAGAKALLLTAPDSPDENARFGALRPSLATCMPEGETLRFGKVALRGTIAINYYRLAHAAAAAGTKAPS